MPKTKKELISEMKDSCQQNYIDHFKSRSIPNNINWFIELYSKMAVEFMLEIESLNGRMIKMEGKDVKH